MATELVWLSTRARGASAWMASITVSIRRVRLRFALAWCKRRRLGQDARSSVRVSSVNSAMSGRQGAAHNGHPWLSTPI
jgi:hypothetical protein